MVKWTPDEQRLARLYLESMPPGQFSLDDWSLLVDYIAQRYLPQDFARTAAEWMATKSVIMGKVQQAAPDMELPEARSEEHTSELQSLMRISYAVFCLKK